MLPIPAELPPPAHIAPALLAEPGTTDTINNTSLENNTGCTILARSTGAVGSLEAPVNLRMRNCLLRPAPDAAAVFIVTNAHADIRLSSCRAGRAHILLLRADEATWGKSGFNAGTARLYAEHSHLEGDIYVGPRCRVELTLGSGSSWNGRFIGPGRYKLRKHLHAVWAPRPIFPPSPLPLPKDNIFQKNLQIVQF